MSTQTTPQSEELDLVDLFSLLKRAFYKGAAVLFKAIAFVLKLWWVILGIIVIGVAIGYFTKGAQPHKASLIIQTNFESQPYVYNAILQINEKLSEKDPEFLQKLGLDVETVGVSKIEITPVIDVVDLLQEIESNDRTLTAVIKELEVDDDIELFASNRFYTNYKFHTLKVALSTPAAKDQIQTIVDYINNEPYGKKLALEASKNYKERITLNTNTLKQIDGVITSYTENAGVLGGGSTPTFYNNETSLNLKDVFNYKSDLIAENQELKNGLVAIDEVTVIVSDIQTSPNTSLKKRTEILYPILLVFLFLCIAGCIGLYKGLERRLREQKLIN